jgi:hypothetical protein
VIYCQALLKAKKGPPTFFFLEKKQSQQINLQATLLGHGNRAQVDDEDLRG